MPPRVLDLGSDQETHLICLIEPGDQHERYIALSYPWGGTSFIKTVRDTLERHKQGIRFDDLPRTFQDAIRICRFLGVRYLWIDALCIIQDDTDDWKEHSRSMGEIYRQSFLTISAVFNTSPHSGLFSEPQVRRVGPVMVFKTQHPFDATKDEQISRGFPLLTRGWTFQERMLSARTLHFSQQEVLWDCMDTLTCQCGSFDPSRGISHLESLRNQTSDVFFRKRFLKMDENDRVVSVTSDRGGTEILFGRYDLPAEEFITSTKEFSELWCQIASRFSALELTYKSDKLAAIAGLADKIEQVTKWTYCVGLWADTLLTDLCWIPGVRESSLQTCQRLPWSTWWKEIPPFWDWNSIAHDDLPFIPPSWSWVSIDGPVWWPQERFSPSSDMQQDILLATVLGSQTQVFPETLDYSRPPIRSRYLELNVQHISLFLEPQHRKRDVMLGKLRNFSDCKMAVVEEGYDLWDGVAAPVYLLPLVVTHTFDLDNPQKEGIANMFTLLVTGRAEGSHWLVRIGMVQTQNSVDKRGRLRFPRKSLAALALRGKQAIVTLI